MRYILALAALNRIVWAYIRYPQIRLSFNETKIGCDSCEYVDIARHLPWTFSLNGSPTAFRAPLYPALIAIFFHPLALSIAQIIISLITCCLVYLIGRKFSERVGIVSASLFALAPMTSQFTSLAMSETLFTFLVTVGVYFWTDKPIGSGVAFGLGILTRPLLLLFVLVLMVLGIKKRSLLWVGLVALLTITPWTVRNALVFKQFIPVSQGGTGVNLYVGTLDIKYGTGGNVWSQILTPEYFANYYSADRDRDYRQRAVSFIAQHPIEWAKIRIKQYPRLYMDGGESFPFGRLRQALFLLGNFLLLVFAVVSWRRELYLIAFPIFNALIHIPLWTENRYSLPMMPMVIILAVLGARRIYFSLVRRPLDNYKIQHYRLTKTASGSIS